MEIILNRKMHRVKLLPEGIDRLVSRLYLSGTKSPERMSLYNNNKDKDKKKGNANAFAKNSLGNVKGNQNTKGVKNTRTVTRSKRGA